MESAAENWLPCKLFRSWQLKAESCEMHVAARSRLKLVCALKLLRGLAHWTKAAR